jgi:hypothetical protein
MEGKSPCTPDRTLSFNIRCFRNGKRLAEHVEKRGENAEGEHSVSWATRHE